MKYRVTCKGKQSPLIPAKKVISLFEKGFVESDAVVTSESGKTIKIKEFVRKANLAVGNLVDSNQDASPPFEEQDWIDEDPEFLDDEEFEDQVGDEYFASESTSDVFEVKDFKSKRNISGQKVLSYNCPNCEAPLSSTNATSDYCPNCGVRFRFQTQQNELDSKQRAAKLGEARQPVKQWLVTAVILIGIIAPLMGRIIYDAVLSDSTNLCKVIFGLFLVAIIRNFLDIKFIGREVATAHEQVQTLITGGSVGDFVRKAESSLLREHVTNLYEISRRNENVSQDNLIVLLQSRINSRIRLTDIAGGMLVTLGLIGTILGLIASFGGIDTVMGNLGGDKSKMLDGFTETLGGMGTAFYTTLMGSILGGVILRALSSVVDSNADALVGQIAELSEVYILPTLRKVASKRSN